MSIGTARSSYRLVLGWRYVAARKIVGENRRKQADRMSRLQPCKECHRRPAFGM